MSTYDYSPSANVRAAHSMPHLTSYYQPREGNFNVTLDNLTATSGYLASLIPFPALIFAAGIFSLVVFMLMLVCRCCFPQASCRPEDREVSHLTTEQYFDWTSKIRSRRRLLLGFFLSFLCMVIIACHLLYFGNASLTKGLMTISESLSDLAKVFQSATTASQAVVSESNSINTLLTTSQCKYANSSSSDPIIFLDASSGAAKVIGDQLGDVPSFLFSIRDVVVFISSRVTRYVVFIFYAAAMSIVVLYTYGLARKSPLSMKFAIFLSIIIIAALTITCCVGMVIVGLLGDMCMNPSLAVSNALNNPIRGIVNYYTTCRGVNPLQGEASNTTYYFAELSSAILNITSDTRLCPNNANLLQTQSKLGTLSKEINNLVSFADCDKYVDVWVKFMFQGVCGSVFDGVYYIWLCEFVSSGGLFLCMCCGSVLYHYYGKFWTASPNMPMEQFDVADRNYPDDDYIASIEPQRVGRDSGGGDVELYDRGNNGPQHRNLGSEEESGYRHQGRRSAANAAPLNQRQMQAQYHSQGHRHPELVSSAAAQSHNRPQPSAPTPEVHKIGDKVFVIM